MVILKPSRFCARSAMIIAMALVLVSQADALMGPPRVNREVLKRALPGVRLPAQTTKTQLGTITVEGYQVPMALALQLLKRALQSPWSTASKDRYKMVCRIQPILGSRFTHLVCMTNAQHFTGISDTQNAELNALQEYRLGGEGQAGDAGDGSMGLMTAFINGILPVKVEGWWNGMPVNGGALHKLLRNVPSLGRNYTLVVHYEGREKVLTSKSGHYPKSEKGKKDTNF